MAWLRLTLQDGRTCVINTDKVSEIYDSVPDRNAEIRLHDGLTIVRESVEQIAGMIAQAELRKRVLAVACAIISNEHSNGLTSEQVWTRAARFATMDPEQEPPKERRRHICERCGGTGVQQAGCWTGKAYDSLAGRCELCDGEGKLGVTETRG
jgi:hypothetical protein